MAIEDRELIRFDGPDDFRAWLDAHADDTPGVRLVLAKKSAPFRTISYAEAVDVALEYGWIDGRTKRIDEHSFEQYFSQRVPKSPWSKRNVEIVTAKIERGEMKPRGLAEVEKAKADGRWDRAYAGPATAEHPPEFLAALESNPAAKAAFESLNSQNRYAIYFRLQEAKRPETRERRIAQFVDMLARGERLY